MLYPYTNNSIVVVTLAQLVAENPALQTGTPSFNHQLIIAANRWANRHYGDAGYPTFSVSPNPQLFQLMLVGNSTWKDISSADLQAANPNFKPNGAPVDLLELARAVNRFADRGRFEHSNCAFITGETGAGGVWGAHGLLHTATYHSARYVEFGENDLAFYEPRFVIGAQNPFDVWTSAIVQVAGNIRGVCAFPNYEIGVDSHGFRVFGAYLITGA